MAADASDEDEYGFSSGDEADLLQTAEFTETNTNSDRRKHARNESQAATLPPAKTSKTSHDSGTSSVALDLANNILYTKFGMSSFRLKQAQAITRILDGGSAVVVFPTGGGKSLCYQVPGVAFKPLDRIRGERQGHAEGGITLVVSPLIALMRDQVEALKRRNIRAAALDSTKTRDEYLATVDAMREGTLDILYCAPERLNNEGFVGSMGNVRGGVRLLAIDEAHCISEWGHAFRPDYLKVARFAKEIQAERVLCLTATATPKVADDVCRAFNIPKDGLFKTPSHRPNLRLLARSFLTKQESYPELIKFLKAHIGPTIIYVTLQQHTKVLAERLRKSGMNAKSYHAGMKTEDKSSCQDEFMASKNLIIVATIAFGMGIDKADIRNVIHYDSPRSLEGYSQEIGRAGRDGKESFCMLYLCAEDFHLRESFARGDLPSKKSLVGLLNEIFSMNPTGSGRDASIECNPNQLSKDYDIKQTVLKNIFAQLELRHELLRETTPKYTSYQYVKVSDTSSDTTPAAEAVRRASKTAKKWTQIDVDRAAQVAGLQRVDVVNKLNEWNSRALIELDQKGVMNIYRILKPFPSATKDRQAIVDSMYKELELREQQDLARGDQVTNMMTRSRCFAATLSEHFGDTLSDDRKECGACSWCETHTPVELKTPPRMPWNSKAFTNILEAVSERDDPRYLARIAFGIMSPRVTIAKLGRSPVFGSMEDHGFMALLSAFEKVCSK